MPAFVIKLRVIVCNSINCKAVVMPAFVIKLRVIVCNSIIDYWNNN